MDFKNANELLDLCKKHDLPISEVMRQREIVEGEKEADTVHDAMARVLEIMKNAAFTPIKEPVRSMGGLIGGEAKKIASRYHSGIGICGDLLEKSMIYAMATLETNASMGKILVQRFGDFVRGRRTTEERLVRNNITPTLKDAVPGDLSLVFPYRIMKDIEEMIYALDEVTPGMASDETLLYGVEVKFYSNKILTNKDFETNIKGLRAIGDGASVTRGLQQASANGLSVAKSILNK